MQAPHPVDGLTTGRVTASLARPSAGDVAPHVTGTAFSGDLAVCHDDRQQGDPCRPIGGAVAETAVLLEAAAIALGASDLTPESMGLARAADAALRACRHDPSAAATLARIFHQALLASCPNTHMLELIWETSDTRSPGRLIEVGVDELGRVADDHEAILDMIVAGAASCDLERSLRQHASSSALCSVGLQRP